MSSAIKSVRAMRTPRGAGAAARQFNLPFAGTCRTTGEIAKFGATVIAETPVVVRLYFAEALRQAAGIILSSSIVIWGMLLVMGAEIGILAHYLLESLGAGDYVALFNVHASLRLSGELGFCWILAAKVGCGFSAELGSMRISEEIDALHVMGMRPRAYLAGTRLLAFWMAGPFLWLTAIGMQYIGAWLTSMPILKTASPGGYSDVFWSFQTPQDLLLGTVWALLMGTVVVIVCCYFGYTASGGPVGVGLNTAKSMVINMVIIGVLSVFFSQLFFGTGVELPIAN